VLSAGQMGFCVGCGGRAVATVCAQRPQSCLARRYELRSRPATCGPSARLVNAPVRQGLTRAHGYGCAAGRGRPAAGCGALLAPARTTARRTRTCVLAGPGGTAPRSRLAIHERGNLHAHPDRGRPNRIASRASRREAPSDRTIRHQHAPHAAACRAASGSRLAD